MTPSSDMDCAGGCKGLVLVCALVVVAVVAVSPSMAGLASSIVWVVVSAAAPLAAIAVWMVSVAAAAVVAEVLLVPLPAAAAGAEQLSLEGCEGAGAKPGTEHVSFARFSSCWGALTWKW